MPRIHAPLNLEVYSLLRLPASRSSTCFNYIFPKIFILISMYQNSLMGGHSTYSNFNCHHKIFNFYFLRVVYTLQTGVTPIHPLNNFHLILIFYLFILSKKILFFFFFIYFFFTSPHQSTLNFILIIIKKCLGYKDQMDFQI